MWRLKTNQALGSLVATFLLSLAWAAPCREQPYTLETPEGLAGGGNLEFDGEVALFTDGACLEARGLTLRAPSLRYDQASGELTAREVEVETPRYRFWAEEAWVKGQTLRASGVRATTCRCGEDLRLLSQSLVLNTQTGEAVLEESWLEVYRFGLARFEELTFSPGQSLGEVLGLTEAGEALPAPLRFDFDQGLNFGLSEFPWPAPSGFPPGSPCWACAWAAPIRCCAWGYPPGRDNVGPASSLTLSPAASPAQGRWWTVPSSSSTTARRAATPLG